jgi:hypothetical protein
MPEFITKNLSAFITIAVITMGGIVSFTKVEAEVGILEGRVQKLESQSVQVVDTLNRIDKRLALLLCKFDSSTCLGDK